MEDEINLKEEQEFFYQMDKMMLWFRSLIEIINTKFIKNTYFVNTNSETIDYYLNYIYDIKDNIDVAKKVYPDVCYYLPELKKVFEQIYNNKLAVEEAEKILKER